MFVRLQFDAIRVANVVFWHKRVLYLTIHFYLCSCCQFRTGHGCNFCGDDRRLTSADAMISAWEEQLAKILIKSGADVFSFIKELTIEVDYGM